MSDFPHLDPSSLPQQLPLMQGFLKKQEETDPKKFESEMKKIKTDADQKKQRKKEQEDNESSKKIIEDAQELIEKREDSLYAIQKPNIKSLLKKKKTDPSETPEKPFTMPSLANASLLFNQNDFTLNLAEPPSYLIEKEKRAEVFELSETEISLDTPPLEGPSFLLTSELNTEKMFTKTLVIEKKAPLENEDKPPSLETKFTKEKKKNPIENPSSIKPKKTNVEITNNILPPTSPFVFSLPTIKTPTPSNLHHFSPDLFALFERIVGVITLIQTKSGISKTTLNLTQPQFASSIFFGSQITIEECDSAPREFNIRFSGSEQAISAFKANKQQLETALTDGFEKGKFHFKVHQVTTDLSAD